MFVQQQLTTCAGCSAVLAIEYSGCHASLCSTVIHGKSFECPACHRWNAELVPLWARPRVVKEVPGPAAGGVRLAKRVPRLVLSRVDDAAHASSSVRQGGSFERSWVGSYVAVWVRVLEVYWQQMVWLTWELTRGV